jgi:hypothetical protein
MNISNTKLLLLQYSDPSAFILCHSRVSSPPRHIPQGTDVQGTMQHFLSHHMERLKGEDSIAVNLYLCTYIRGTESQGREWLE